MVLGDLRVGPQHHRQSGAPWRPRRGPSHNPARPIISRSAAVTAGQGDGTASTGAKTKPVPMYQDEPARSGTQHEVQPAWNRRGWQRESSRMVVLLCVPTPSTLPPAGWCRKYLRRSVRYWSDHLTSGLLAAMLGPWPCSR